MMDPRQQRRFIRFSHHELQAAEVLAHLQKGKLISKLTLTWQDRIAFMLSADLSIKHIRFLDLVQEDSQAVHAETAQERFDVDFAIMSAEFSALLARLSEELCPNQEKAQQQTSDTPSNVSVAA